MVILLFVWYHMAKETFLQQPSLNWSCVRSHKLSLINSAIAVMYKESTVLSSPAGRTVDTWTFIPLKICGTQPNLHLCHLKTRESFWARGVKHLDNQTWFLARETLVSLPLLKSKTEKWKKKRDNIWVRDLNDLVEPNIFFTFGKETLFLLEGDVHNLINGNQVVLISFRKNYDRVVWKR